MSKKYYVKLWNDTIIGPYSFKEARRRQDEMSVPSEILVLVVDANGREVR